MLLTKNNFSQDKNKSRYEREISLILYKLVQEHNLPSCSLSYCQLSTRGEHVKIYGDKVEVCTKKYESKN